MQKTHVFWGSSVAAPTSLLLHLRVYLAVSLWLLVLQVPQASALSDCQRCEETGDCSTAYRGTPGQFCGHWLDRANQRQSCCCPVGAVCRVSNYACNCAARNAGSRPRDTYEADPLLWLWWLLGSLALVACCAGCIYALCARNTRGVCNNGDTGDEPVLVAYPVNAPSGAPGTAYAAAPGGGNYGTTPPLYSTPGNAAPAYGGYRGGMGTGTAAALGGAGGLLGGVLLGEALTDAGHSRGYDGGGGFVGDGGGGGGGFDSGVGDFGGDF